MASYGHVFTPPPYAGAILAGVLPSNPTGTTSTTQVMMGIGGTCAITPLYSTRMRIVIVGQLINNTGSDGANVSLRTGTGTAPTNGAALTGTVRTQAISMSTPLGGSTGTPFTLEAVVSGLTVGTAIWIDLSVAATVGGTASVSNLTCSAHEV